MTAVFGPLDPEVAEMLATGDLASAEAVSPTMDNLARLRARAATVPPAPPPDVAATVRDVVVGDMDAGRVSVRVYAPADS
ncbi:MAG: hypothetical protein QOH89_2250, partial [Pseudonocardiales bacterium]|nr:hypothetical protein [Pseudonocardiales bacterium]